MCSMYSSKTKVFHKAYYMHTHSITFSRLKNMQVGVGDGNVLPNMFQSDILRQNERRVVVLGVFYQVETEDWNR